VTALKYQSASRQKKDSAREWANYCCCCY